jgi:hypothetical protein
MGLGKTESWKSKIMSNKLAGPDTPKPTLQPQENITQAQVTHLLNIFIPACNFLIADKMHNPDGEERSGGKSDGGALMAVENTVVNICNRFDTMLAEESRWTLASHTSLEESFKQVYTEHARMLAEQANAYAEINSPHSRMKPTLLKISEGSWVAFLGDLNDINNAIVGAGACPADAIMAFDAMFEGKVTEELKAWLAAHGMPLENKTEKQNEQIQTVDETKLERPEIPPGSRKVKPRNRRRPGTDSKEC